jgi:CRP-like cAMP-binding protein
MTASVQQLAVRAFNRIPLLSSLNEEETYELLRICRMRTFDKGAELFRQGEDGRSAMIIETGRVEVRVESGARREAVATLGAYDVLGELALIDPGPRSATVVAMEPTTVYELMSSDFGRLREQRHPAAFKVMRGISRVVCSRIRNVNDRIEAHLAGRDPLPPRAGEFDAVSRGRRATTGAPSTAAAPPTGAQRTAPVRAAAPTPMTTNAVPADGEAGFFKRLASRLWGQGD